jgi:pyruvate,orthophosphate dikinase
MPGMMDTILNVGLSPETEVGFAQLMGSEAGAADCLARLRQMFDDVTGGPAPTDTLEQLQKAIVAIFESWSSKRAQLYRRFHKIPDTGTAAVVQAMVFGNIGEHSGTGVAFTRDPSTGEPELFGEYLANGQGEDVVNGSRNVGDLEDLRAHDPQAHAELRELARKIERHFGDMCELEFTLERGRLWLLQTRSGHRSAPAAVRIAVQLVHEGLIDRTEALDRVDLKAVEEAIKPKLDNDGLDRTTILTTGTGSSPGLATGALALDSDGATARAAAGEAVILVRPETTPKDLDGMIACAGLLTTRGGKTSHAAVVARGLGKTCVCGAEEIVVDPDGGRLQVGSEVLVEGDIVSIDGDGGLVMRGTAPALEGEPPEELAELHEWARTGIPAG